jgi:photosystem II stability/assembly factor-like uncharacterized protein
MNRLLSLLAVLGLLLLSNATFGQGPRFFHKQGGRIKKSFFLDNTHGWTAEDGARTRFTLDGGLTWAYGDTKNVREELGNVFFINTSDGWAVTLAGSVLRSFDGGVNWDKINTNPAVIPDVNGQPAKLNTIFMFDGLDGWVGGDDGALWVTSTGGATWTEAPNLPDGFKWNNLDPEDAYKIHFWNSSDGYMVADYFHAYSTSNGGASWLTIDLEPVSAPCGADHNLELWDFDFGDSLTHGVMAAGVGVQEGFLFQTQDSGQSWSMASCFADLPPALDCTPPTTYGVTRLGAWPSAAVSGYDSMLLVNQVAAPAVYDECLCGPPGAGPCSAAAASWKRLDVPSDFSPPLFGITRIGTTAKTCVVGTFGIIRIFDTAASTTVDKGTKHYARLEGGAFTSSTAGCVVGQAYTIYRTTNSGADWTQAYPPLPAVPNPLDGWGRDIAFSTSGVNGVAVGDAGFTAWSSNSGASWTLNTHAAVNFQSVAFVPGTTTVFAGGLNGVLRKSINGGATWTTPAQPGTTETITSISFADSQNGYLVGTGEVVFGTSDGGASWNPVETVDNDGVVTSFFGVDTWGNGSPALAVGSNGRVYEKTGNRFVKVNLTSLGVNVTAHTLTDVEVFASGPNLNVRICGTAGLMLFRDNGTWSQPKSQTNEDHFALSFTSPSVGYGIGRPFLITKYE